ncbi:MAG: hypothetical protein MZU97_25190 [Bacillus subtilis]|nr:hypothetical protein [Bacillus subtilis]
MYHTHPVKDEVLGTVQTIRSMDKETLERGPPNRLSSGEHDVADGRRCRSRANLCLATHDARTQSNPDASASSCVD